LHLGCPFAHRTNIIYQLKRLESLISLSILSIHKDESGSWTFDGTGGSHAVDSVEGFKNLKELYGKASPGYTGRYASPLIWDRKKKQIVNNESADIIRIFSTAFDLLLPLEIREINRPNGGLRPNDPNLRREVDQTSRNIDDDINWGTYKCGMAGSQLDYDKAIKLLFDRLDEMEEKLSHSTAAAGPTH
jgi:putative glutathione S-transferase